MTTPETSDFPTLDFYSRFYDALPRSTAYSEFCRQLYGMDLGQQGFADMAQVDALLDALQLKPGANALDIGCGDGRMAEYISDRSRAFVTGLDLIPSCIQRALSRTSPKRDRLNYVSGDMAGLECLFERESFDALIAIDTLYFTDLLDTVRQMRDLLKPGGRMGIFYSHGADPWHPIETFPRDSLHPESGPLATALRANSLRYRWLDFSGADYALAGRAKAIVEALRPTYVTEDDSFLCECRMDEAEGILAAHESGVQARHLFLAWR